VDEHDATPRALAFGVKRHDRRCLHTA
jgi:hypothetical protein